MVQRKILCIDYSRNWSELFAKKTLANGDTITVDQVEWKDISLVASTQEGITLNLKAAENPFPFTKQKEDRLLENPDMVLIRNFPTDLHGVDYKKIILGFMFAGVQSVNTFSSLLMCMNRVLSHGEMKRATDRAQKLLSEESKKEFNISVVPMVYHPNQGTKVQEKTTQFPAVIKVGDTHAGYGKMRVQNKSDEDDLCSILALNNNYYTVEPFVKYEYEYRIQKIGDNIRCFRRNNTNRKEEGPSDEWKNNWGNLAFEDHPVLPHHKIWIDECAKIFGGLDIVALDVLHCKNGDEIALELNDTACGLMYQHESEDVAHIRDLVLQKMNSLFP